MIAFDGMGVYNENVQQYIVNNGYAINAQAIVKNHLQIFYFCGRKQRCKEDKR